MKSVFLPAALFTLILAPLASAQITDFCFGDGSGTACPCANSSAIGANEGCLNSLLKGGKLRAVGNPSLSDDGDGSPALSLDGSQMTVNWYAYFQGTAVSQGGAGLAFGDGLRCASGTMIRLHFPLRFTDAFGASQYPDPSLFDPPISVKGLVTSAGSVRYYQLMYRNPVATFCTVDTFNTTNGVEVVWGP